MKNIVIIGPPGSGKDTQIERLNEIFCFETISTGDIARELAEEDDRYRQIVESGGLLNDSVLTERLDKRVGGIPLSMSIVFDGYPRTLRQADVLGEILRRYDRTLDSVIYISLDEAAVIDRLSSRKICADCGHNILDLDRCPICGGVAARRHDDDPAVIKKRVKTFLESTLPLTDYYRNLGILIEINGDQPIEAVALEIKGRFGYAGK